MANNFIKVSGIWLRDWLLDILIIKIITHAPWLVSAMTGVLGVFQGIPWAYLLAAMALAFGGTASGLVRFDDWKEKNRVKDKLNTSIVKAVKDIDGNGWRLGFELNSIASFPIAYEIESLSTHIDRRQPNEPSNAPKDYILPPYGRGGFNDSAIAEIDDSPGERVTGTLEARIKYGKPGNLKLNLTINREITMLFGDDGQCHFHSRNL